MIPRWEYEDPEPFVKKLKELRERGVPADRIAVLMPYPVHGFEQIMGLKPSPLRFFTLGGALTGLVLGFAFPILTVRDWPLITGGKPLISIPPFVVIAFALTILLGALASFVGFLHLSRLPSVPGIQNPEEHGNRFVIEDHSEGVS